MSSIGQIFLQQNGNGNPIIPPGSNQSVDVAVVAYHPGEENPTNVSNLVNGESLVGQSPVFWYSATGYQPQDTFFMHGGFFEPEAPTPAGTAVAVQPQDEDSGATPVSVAFANVTQAGTSGLSMSQVGPAPPPGMRLSGGGVFYDVTTSAQYTGSVRVCITHDGSHVFNPAAVRLFHLEGNQWVDRTVSNDPTSKTVCGDTTSLSPFAIFEPGSTIYIPLVSH